MTPHTPAIQVRDLHVRRGTTTVFDGFSVDVAPGRLTGLLGPSGCGKSTLIRSIVGVQKIAAGTVTVLGLPGGDKRLRTRVAYSSQADGIYRDLTVRENLAYFASLLHAPPADIDRAIDTVGLGDKRHDRVDRLSGGQVRRVSLAMALLGTPEVVVLDEPTVGLDPVLRRDLWDVFARQAASGVTFLVSSHVMDEATRCDDLILLRDGQLVAQTTPSDLLAMTGCPDADSAFLALIAQAQRHDAAPDPPDPLSQERPGKEA